MKADIEQARELLPCPFCGNSDLGVGQWVECHTCSAFGPGYELGDPLVLWNQRRPAIPKTLATVTPPRDLRTKLGGV
ncbi:hypothetical protein [Stenotrophomonas sp. AB1(2024)]|uniref:hypothetical protein n=1 Tax=Stenotrophomonas sp. AB1(2024) TaxID=3132215 RepID=UPI0030AFCACB